MFCFIRTFRLVKFFGEMSSVNSSFFLSFFLSFLLSLTTLYLLCPFVYNVAFLVISYIYYFFPSFIVTVM
jgi:hypothetical protein